MVLVTKDVDGAIHIAPVGRFDFSCYKDFHAAVAGAPRRIVVDLSKTDYIDSSALGMLQLAREKVGGDGNLVRIVGATGQPEGVLRMANFHRIFSIESVG